MTNNTQWTPCTIFTVGDTLKWIEPLWAPPNKPRGKRDKIGEQEVTAKLITKTNILELEVIELENKSTNSNSKITIKEGDIIKRKMSSIEKSNCYKLTNH